MASLILNNATNQVYEVLSKTDLTLTNWTIEPGEVWPTNSTVMPFTVSIPDRTKALFIRAADWTGVTENGNTVPDWWFWKYFGTVALSDTNLDTVGNTLLTGSSNGWWALYLSPDGTQLSFGTSTNGGGMANLSANISWASNEWHQIALTYSPASSALYVDGQLLANGIGIIVTHFD